MATAVIMPALGMDQDYGTLVRWIKQPGETVTKGEPIMEVETDKVVVEIDAIATGLLVNVTAIEGDQIPVGQIIAQILDAGEAGPEQVSGLDHLPALANAFGVEDELAEAEPNLPPLPQRLAQGTASPSSPTARLTPASPKARRLASELGIEITRLSGSGPSGAVLASDINATSAAPANTAGYASVEPNIPVGSTPDTVDVAVSGAWRVMAGRMTASWTSAPHFFLMREVIVTGLVDMRNRLLPAVERRAGVRLTYTDLLVKLVAVALQQHPRLSASLIDGVIRQNPHVNIGIAIAAGESLVVPVICSADAQSIGDIAARRQDLVERGEAGKLTLDDLTGGTFTLTNLGMYNVDAFSAIINPPQAAILAVGRIAERVVAIEGQPAVRPTLILSLSCDHRVVDGAQGARFLDDLATLIEEPWGLLA